MSKHDLMSGMSDDEIASDVLPQTNPVFLTREQLASRWACSISTLKRLEKEGHLRAIRLGPRIIRYNLEAIEKIEVTH